MQTSSRSSRSYLNIATTHFVFALILVLGVASAPTQGAPIDLRARNPIPPKAKELLASLPGKQISLDLVIGRALLKSDSYAAIFAQGPLIEVPRLTSRAPLDYQLTLNGYNLIDENEASSPFFPNRQVQTKVTLGVSTLFRSGTAVSFELGHSKNELEFPPPATAQPPFYETTGALSISQNLWKNFFGIGTRASLEAGTKRRDAAELQIQEQVEETTRQLSIIFFDAWFKQTQVKAAEESVERNKRLVQITRLKVQRGTAERPDLLQMLSNLAAAEVDLRSARQKLAEVWRNLVISLKFPLGWTGIDPMLIPIENRDYSEEAVKDCESNIALIDKDLPKNTSTQRTILEAEAAENEFTSAKWNAYPEANFFFKMAPNGVDTTGSTAFGEALSVDHPEWLVGMEFKMPLGNQAAEATYRQALAQRDRAEALRSQAVNNLKVEWSNACSDLDRLNEAVATLRQSYENQKERVRLEENRFRIGRSTTLQVSAADAEAVGTEVALRSNEMARKIASWRIFQLANKYKPYLEDVTTRFRDFKYPDGVFDE